MTVENGQIADFYVATDGNDGWTGSLESPNTDKTDGPFATLARARDAVRDLKERGTKEDIVVWIRGGRYYLKDTVVFGLQDSAAEGYTISYAAYPGEEPIFSSGVKIEGWKELEREWPEGLSLMAQSKVWVADVPSDLELFRTLYDGDRRLPRARSEGFIPTYRHQYKMDGQPGEYKGLFGDVADYPGPLDPLYYLPFPKGAPLRSWENMEDVELVIRATVPWTMQILPLESVDEEWCVAKTAVQSGYVLGAMGGGAGPYEKHAWIENIPEALDYPGEWVVNSREKKLYLWPTGDEPGDQIFAPCLIELIRVEGDVDVDGPTDTPVRGIVFKGITFTQGDRGVVADGDMSIQHDWVMIDRGHALLRLRGAEECVVENCMFFNSGGEAIRLDLHCQRNRVAGNEINHLGSAGILLLGYGPGTKDVNKQNEILNNHIHHSGELIWHAHGIILHQSGENRIAHNYIHHMPRKAISLSGVRPQFFNPEDAYTVLNQRECAPSVRWHEIENPEKVQEDARKARAKDVIDWPEITPYLHTRDNVVEYNEVHRAVQHGGDGAAINVSGTGEGNIVRRNYVHHIFNKNITGAIRTDDFVRKTTFEENVIFKTNSCGLIHRHETYTLNNVVCDVHPGTYMWIDQRLINGSRIKGNIFLHTGKWKEAKGSSRWDGMFWTVASWIVREGLSIWQHLGRMKNVEIEGNVYYDLGGDEESVEVLERLRENGYGESDIYSDPLFVDWEKGDFRLQPGSPALEMGIKSIDVSEAGLTEDFPRRFR